MIRYCRAGFGLAALSLVVFAQDSRAEPATLPELIAELESWLDANSSLPPRENRPVIQMLSPSHAAGQYGSPGYAQGRLRAFYGEETQTITLVAPWNIRDPVDQGVLLHELAHHRQAARHWACDAAQELPAYRLQAKWSHEKGVEVRINWLAAVLESGCEPHDFHPD